METVKDVRDALSARSRTATLEQLASEGRKKVRLIKAEHVAAMIHAAVHSAIESSGLVSKDEADRLVERSRTEFKSLMREREDELQRLAELQDALQTRDQAIADRDQEIARLKQELMAARTAAPTMAAAPSLAVPGVAAAAGSAPTLAASPDLSAAIEKLAGSLNDRLEKLGKKMGISAAVEGEEVKFDGLFKDTGKDLESNMGNIQVKQKSAGGIAANLERLKKLKGGG